VPTQKKRRLADAILRNDRLRRDETAKENPYYRSSQMVSPGRGRKPTKLCNCCGRDVNGRFLHFMTDVERRVWCAMCMEFALAHVSDIDAVRAHVAHGPRVEGAELLEPHRKFNEANR